MELNSEKIPCASEAGEGGNGLGGPWIFTPLKTPPLENNIFLFFLENVEIYLVSFKKFRSGVRRHLMELNSGKIFGNKDIRWAPRSFFETRFFYFSFFERKTDNRPFLFLFFQTKPKDSKAFEMPAKNFWSFVRRHAQRQRRAEPRKT